MNFIILMFLTGQDEKGKTRYRAKSRTLHQHSNWEWYVFLLAKLITYLPLCCTWFQKPKTTFMMC